MSFIVKKGINNTDEFINSYKTICKELNIYKNLQKYAFEDSSSEKAMSEIAKKLGFKCRKIILSNRWWIKDGENMIGFFENGEPIALIKSSPESYLMYKFSPEDNEILKFKVDDKNVYKILDFGYEFYKSFPREFDKKNDLIKFILSCIWKRDILIILLMGILVAVLGIITPIFMKHIYSQIIPEKNIPELIKLGVVLILISISSFFFEIARNISIERIQGKIEIKLEAAIWENLLNLPVNFYKKFTSGDLVNRANSISTVQKSLSGIAINAIFNILFSIIYLFLFFYFNLKFALVGILLALIAGISTSILSINQNKYVDPILKNESICENTIFHLIQGVIKFKAFGTENEAYNIWYQKYLNYMDSILKYQNITVYIKIVNSIFPTLVTIILYYMVVEFKNITIADFLGFYSAYFTFLYIILDFSNIFSDILYNIPMIKRIVPIIESETEISGNEKSIINGIKKIKFENVNFRYNSSCNRILNDLSFEINSGETIAVVGMSGSGKSTLVRLLIGFEQSESGKILYDENDIKELDIQNLRNKFGIVLQNSELIGETIFSNIVGATQKSIDEAWEAARLAGIDNDIKNMPMGMHTIVSGGVTNLSGGQKQRVMIAHAIMKQPEILILDEATSGLDNITQDIVMDNILKMNMTRIIISHRLSTIIKANRIIVLNEGKIVEMGTYEELLKRGNIFKRLIQRQII